MTVPVAVVAAAAAPTAVVAAAAAAPHCHGRLRPVVSAAVVIAVIVAGGALPPPSGSSSRFRGAGTDVARFHADVGWGGRLEWGGLDRRRRDVVTTRPGEDLTTGSVGLAVGFPPSEPHISSGVAAGRCGEPGDGELVIGAGAPDAIDRIRAAEGRGRSRARWHGGAA